MTDLINGCSMNSFISFVVGRWIDSVGHDLQCKLIFKGNGSETARRSLIDRPEEFHRWCFTDRSLKD
jgi:hypothetical protein